MFNVIITQGKAHEEEPDIVVFLYVCLGIRMIGFNVNVFRQRCEEGLDRYVLNMSMYSDKGVRKG